MYGPQDSRSRIALPQPSSVALRRQSAPISFISRGIEPFPSLRRSSQDFMYHFNYRSRSFLHRAITLLFILLCGTCFGTSQVTQIPSTEVEGRVDAILSE